MLNMLEYSITDNEHGESLGRSHVIGPCVVYAIVQEDFAGVTKKICGGDIRERHAYTSVTNSVQINIITSETIPHFIIRYEGNAHEVTYDCEFHLNSLTKWL